MGRVCAPPVLFLFLHDLRRPALLPKSRACGALRVPPPRALPNQPQCVHRTLDASTRRPRLPPFFPLSATSSIDDRRPTTRIDDLQPSVAAASRSRGTRATSIQTRTRTTRSTMASRTQLQRAHVRTSISLRSTTFVILRRAKARTGSGSRHLDLFEVEPSAILNTTMHTQSTRKHTNHTKHKCKMHRMQCKEKKEKGHNGRNQ